MGYSVWLTAVVTAAGSVLLTYFVRSFTLARGYLDVPNPRSSHTVPTPRGGGLAIVVTASLGFVALALMGDVHRELLCALLVGGWGVAIVGYIDDRRPLPAGLRLAVHSASAVAALAFLGGPLVIQFSDRVVNLGIFGYVLGTLGIVWTLNLFNFMDGIDGLAASEAVFVGLAGSILWMASGMPTEISAAALIFGAACLGFLAWNWPPARIFMGDVGSGYLGYIIAVLALAASRDSPVAILVWLILGGAFFVDATVTFVRRLARGERVYEAHRTHAYQWLARRWRGHKGVTVAVLFLNLLWLFASAFVALRNPAYAGWVVLGALTPVVVVVVAAGAGRKETPSG